MRLSAQRKSLNSISLASSLAGASVFTLCIGLAPGQAHATPACGVATANSNSGTDFVVSGSVTQTCTVNANDTLTVQNAGSIATTVGHGVNSTGGATSVVNDGLISASEASARAFANSGAFGTFINTGTLQGLSGAAALANIGTITLFDNSGGTITSLITSVNNAGTMTLTNNGGVIDNTSNSGGAINSTGILHLDNTNGLIEAVNGGALAISAGTINNTNGIIRAQDASAMELKGPLSGSLINIGGLFTSANSEETDGTVEISNDVGSVTITGGTIINTNNTESSVSAVAITSDQTGVITFDGVNIIADGTGVAQGYGIYLYEVDATINLTSTTLVRGNIYEYCCESMNIITSGTIIGDIVGGSHADSVTVNGGSITGTLFLDRGNDAFTLNAGTVNGDVNMGSGNDTATINGGTLNGTLNLEAMNVGVIGFNGVFAPIPITNNDTVTLNGGTVNGNIELGSGDDTFTYNGGILNGNVDFGDGVNTFNVNAVFATDGRLFTTDSFEATNLYVGSSGDFTINDAIDLQLGSIYVADGGRLYVAGANVTTIGGLSNAGTVQIGVGRSLNAGVLDNTVAGHLIFDTAGVANVMHTGSIQLVESAADLSMQTVGVNFTGGALAMPSRSLIASGTSPAVLSSAPVTDNSFLYDFGLEIDGTSPNDIYLTLTRATTVEEAATTPNNAGAGKVIVDGLGGSTDPVINQIQARLSNASNQEQFNEILEATTPTADSGNQVAAVGMTGAMFDLADGQLAMVNTGSPSGVAGGNSLTGLHFWGQGFGAKADQGFRGGIDGYDAQVRGVAMGVDTRELRKDTVVGLSLGIANTDVGSRNANRTSTNVDSYQLMAYGNQELGSDIFLTGMAVAGWNRNDQTRHNVGGIGGLDADADYDSWVGGVRGSIGRNFRYGPDAPGGGSFLLTPQLFSEYVHFGRDGYTETGAGGADLTIGDAKQDILNFGVSLQAEWTYIMEGGRKVMPDVHVAYKYDVIGDQTDTTASFAAGGATFSSQGVDPARSTFVLGAGLKLFDTSGWDFTTNYDYSFKDDYKAHSGFVRAAYQF